MTSLRVSVYGVPATRQPRMTVHVHPPGTSDPASRDAFLIDGCPRCSEYVDDLGRFFDADRFREFWQKMVAVEWDYKGDYASEMDRLLARRLYGLSVSLERLGVDPRDLLSPPTVAA